MQKQHAVIEPPPDFGLVFGQTHAVVGSLVEVEVKRHIGTPASGRVEQRILGGHATVQQAVPDECGRAAGFDMAMGTQQGQVFGVGVWAE